MRPGDRRRKGPAKKARHEHETWPHAPRTSSPPRAWTNKTMHHPATRIGEIKHGKS
jgi:hypothetical protein